MKGHDRARHRLRSSVAAAQAARVREKRRRAQAAARPWRSFRCGRPIGVAVDVCQPCRLARLPEGMRRLLEATDTEPAV